VSPIISSFSRCPASQVWLPGSAGQAERRHVKLELHLDGLMRSIEEAFLAR